MTTPQLADIVWRKSSRSNGQTECVELATDGRTWSAIRDSKQGDQGPVLHFPATSLRAFLTTSR